MYYIYGSNRTINIFFDAHMTVYSTGCSLNIVYFSKNSRKFATSPSPVLGCYWLYKKLPANRSDCTLALRWELWRSLTAMQAREGLQWIVKKHNFSWTPCSISVLCLFPYLNVFLWPLVFSVICPCIACSEIQGVPYSLPIRPIEYIFLYYGLYTKDNFVCPFVIADIFSLNAFRSWEYFTNPPRNMELMTHRKRGTGVGFPRLP